MKKVVSIVILTVFFWVFNVKSNFTLSLFGEAEAVGMRSPIPALLLGLNASPSVAPLIENVHYHHKEGGKVCKSNVTAGVLAILLGGFGIHYFYVGNIGLGILFLLLCWTGIPSIIALITGILWLTDEEGFNRKYCRDKYEE